MIMSRTRSRTSSCKVRRVIRGKSAAVSLIAAPLFSATPLRHAASSFSNGGEERFLAGAHRQKAGIPGDLDIAEPDRLAGLDGARERPVGDEIERGRAVVREGGSGGHLASDAVGAVML